MSSKTVLVKIDARGRERYGEVVYYLNDVPQVIWNDLVHRGPVAQPREAFGYTVKLFDVPT